MALLGRRQWLRAATACASLVSTQQASADSERHAAPRALVPDPQRILDLPAGFSYRILSRMGERMHDGYRVPGDPDAMGVFSVDGDLVLMRNHEVAPGQRAHGPFPDGVKAPKEAYDPEAFGGVTRLVLDAQTLAVKRQELALCGTHWNCAGGLSPWGWLTCEEIFVAGHGYVFLAPHTARGLTQARPIPQYGRFRHEAASVDPQTTIAYLTEDREDAAFYRFVPRDPAQPFEGKLQALRVREQPRCDVNTLHVGEPVAIDWVDVPNPDSGADDVRLQAQAHGAARFARTEGLWLGQGELHMCATIGGPIGRGQILRVQHAGAQPTLTVIAQSDDPAVLDMPDNITVAPHGELFIAEDGLEGNYLRCLQANGQISDFARNARSQSELTGPCFAPDGSTLFVNLQRDGLTLAIRGPFAARGVAAPSGSHAHAAARYPGAGFGGIGVGLAAIGLATLMRRRRARDE